MGMLVSRGFSKLSCDYVGCKKESDTVSGDNDGQNDVRKVMQRRGWQCVTNGKDYCPKHAYHMGEHLKEISL